MIDRKKYIRPGSRQDNENDMENMYQQLILFKFKNGHCNIDLKSFDHKRLFMWAVIKEN
jgi:hypothetical protein